MGTFTQWYLKGLFLFVTGFIIASLRTIYLFLKEWDLVNAFWPHAILTLEVSMIMREHIRLYSGVVSLLLICSAVFFISETRGWKAPKYSGVIISLFSGIIIGLLVQHMLLDWSYFRGGFLLLPTLLAVILLLMCSIPLYSGEKQYKQKNSREKILRSIGAVFACLLMAPGLNTVLGFSPSPPSQPAAGYGGPPGPYDVSIQAFPYDFPDEIESMRRDYETDVDFSVYLALPKLPEQANLSTIPMAILLHGFASPSFDSYRDWVEHLAARGVAVVYIQYLSDVWPEGADDFDLIEQNGMSNHPQHLPRKVVLDTAVETIVQEIILPSQNGSFSKHLHNASINPSHLLIGGHSLGAGYALVVMDAILEKGWGNESLFVSLEASYARPVQPSLQINISKIPPHTLVHTTIAEDDMSVNDCFSVFHQNLFKNLPSNNNLLLEIQSDRHGFPPWIASHYYPATEVHDELADWGFYRRVDAQGDWLSARNRDDTNTESWAYNHLFDPMILSEMGDWSDGTPVKPISIWEDALNTVSKFSHCGAWKGP